MVGRVMPVHGARPWTDAEDKRLLRMYREGYERDLIAESLGRPAKSITERKRKLLPELSLVVVSTRSDNPRRR